MHIGIDASRATVPQRTGTEGYSINVIQRILEIGDAHQFTLYFRDSPPEGLFPQQDNIKTEVILRKRLWTHTGLKTAVNRDAPDVFFVPAHVIPWPAPDIPSVVTVHDLGYLHYPDKHPLFDRMYLNWSTRHSAQVARRVIAVSQATAHDLINLNGTPAEKVKVVHSGVDTLLENISDQGQINALKGRYGIPGPYILHVGSLQPRKNLNRLVSAFERIRDCVEGLSLVLAGRQAWGYDRLKEHITSLGLGKQVILPGYIPDEDLSTLYSGAAVYAFPSLYEGFGFPALEAMQCGTPVVCSNTSSLPELVGDSALTFAPTDETSLAEALKTVLTDEETRKSLTAKGFEKVKAFSWEKTARMTLDIIAEAASGV